jgi:hypothetical protein
MLREIFSEFLTGKYAAWQMGRFLPRGKLRGFSERAGGVSWEKTHSYPLNLKDMVDGQEGPGQSWVEGVPARENAGTQSLRAF